MTLLQLIDVVLTAMAAIVLLPTLAFCVECLAAVLPGRRKYLGAHDAVLADIINAPRPRAAVLIPAHDEQAVIEQTVRGLIPTLAPGDRLLVVADNCSDDTAELACRAGAEVVERCNAEQRGKGHALDFGLAVLSRDPPDVVVVIDADCLAEPATVDILTRLAHDAQRPVQALNLTDRNPASGAVQVVSTLGNRFTNLIRPLGLRRLGLPCRLMGTGMAIPWSLASAVRPAGGNLVEDMQLGIDLALAGHATLFCPEARVTSGLPNEDRAFVSQRTRWEHGHLLTAATQIPRLLVAAVRRSSWTLLGMAIDLGIPPLTLLAALWLTATALAGLAWWLGASWLPAAMLLGGGGLLAASIGLGWLRFCRRQVPLRAFAAVPWYMLRKTPIYARLIFHRQHAWVRTQRDAPACRKSPR